MANDWEQVCDKIIAMLKANATLNSEVKSWIVGNVPADRIPRYPAIMVYLKGGSIDPPVGDSEQEHMDYLIVNVQNKPQAEEKAERAALEHARIIKDVLKLDRALGNLVATSYRTHVDTDRISFRPREGHPFSIVAMVTTLHTRKKVT